MGTVWYHMDTPNKRLMTWVSNQRVNYKKGDMPQKRIEMLNDIGFVWKVDPYNADASLHQSHWDDMFQELCRFQRAHGHTQVFVHTHTEGYHEKLGQWTNMQRTFRRNQEKCMTEERLQKLESIGFWWGSPGNTHENEPVLEKQWNDMFEKMKAFKCAHGHLLVNTNESDGNDGLGSWVHLQRILHNKNQLQQRRKEQLDSIGFIWRGTDARIDHQWMTMYNKLLEFYEIKGHSHVPSSCEDRKLAGWVSKQRHRASDGAYMTKDRRKLLNEVSFQWTIGIGKYERSLSESNFFKGARKRRREESSTTEEAPRSPIGR